MGALATLAAHVITNIFKNRCPEEKNEGVFLFL
jgi:hypothetical protein